MEYDEFYTIKKNIEFLKKIIPKDLTIWCPADKEHSAFVQILRENGNKVYHTHIDNGEDFIMYEPQFKFDMIITNPPYSIKHFWVKKCVEYGKPFLLLIPNTMMIDGWIRKNYNDITFFAYDKRCRFENPSGKYIFKSEAMFIGWKTKLPNMTIERKI